MIKSIFFDKGNLGSVTVEFSSGRSYECYISVDELFINAKFDVPFQIEGNSLSVCNPYIKEEVKWCEDHYDELMDLYEEK